MVAHANSHAHSFICHFRMELQVRKQDYQEKKNGGRARTDNKHGSEGRATKLWETLWRRLQGRVGTSYMIPIVCRYIDSYSTSYMIPIVYRSYSAVFLVVYRGTCLTCVSWVA